MSHFAESALQEGFYSAMCPQAEATLYNTLKDLTVNDPDLPAVLLRLHFHDCFVRVSVIPFITSHIIPDCDMAK